MKTGARLTVALAILVLAMAAPVAAQSMPPATYASGETLKATIRDQPPTALVGAQVENTEDIHLYLLHRTVPQGAIVHATSWEIHHIVDGRGTIVTGGRLVRPAGASNARSPATIEGGESRQVSQGDVVVIPPGTPHWYPEIEGSVTYLEIRYRVE